MKIVLNEKEHTYTSSEGIRYVSATDLIEKFKNPFDAVAASIDYAKKNGQTPEYWQAKWAEGLEEGNRRGNKLHRKKEELYNGRGAIRFRNSVRYVQNQAFYPDLENLVDGVYTELILWLESYQLAGKADLVNIRTERDGRYADIDDHKTGKRIHTKGYSQGGATPKKMLFPLNHLDDCNFTHHELQVSIYMYMLEMQGYLPGVLQFTHYPHPGPDGVTPEPIVYPLQYRKREVKAMLQHHRRNG